jgi:hypothetical protein
VGPLLLGLRDLIEFLSGFMLGEFINVSVSESRLVDSDSGLLIYFLWYSEHGEDLRPNSHRNFLFVYPATSSIMVSLPGDHKLC